MSSASSTVSFEILDDSETIPIAGSPFLQLPIDVRHIIFKYALVANQAIDWPAEHSSHGLALGLLQTCRQIYHEATPILYKYNRFTFSHPSDCNVFRWIMDSNYASQISNVAFKIRERDLRVWTAYHLSDDPIRSLGADVPNLQSLVVFLRQQGWHFSVDPDEAFRLWNQSQRLRNVCMSLEKISANVTVVCSMEISQRHFEHLTSTQASALAIYGGYARTTKGVEINSTMAVLELFSPKSSCAETQRIIGI